MEAEVLEEEDRTIDRMTLGEFCIRHNLHKDLAPPAGPAGPAAYSVGDAVEGNFKGDWFPCTIHAVSVVEGETVYTVDWGAEQMTYNMHTNDILYPQEAAEHSPAEGSPAKPAKKDAAVRKTKARKTAGAPEHSPADEEKFSVGDLMAYLKKAGTARASQVDAAGDVVMDERPITCRTCVKKRNGSTNPYSRAHTRQKGCEIYYAEQDAKGDAAPIEAPEAMPAPSADAADAVTKDVNVIIDAAVHCFRDYLRSLVTPGPYVPLFRVNADCAWTVEELAKAGASAALTAACTDGAVSITGAARSKKRSSKPGANAAVKPQKSAAKAATEAAEAFATAPDAGLALLQRANANPDAATEVQRWLMASLTPAEQLPRSPKGAKKAKVALASPKAKEAKEAFKTPSGKDTESMSKAPKLATKKESAKDQKQKQKDKQKANMMNMMSRFVVKKKREAKKESTRNTMIEPYVRCEDARYDDRELRLFTLLETPEDEPSEPEPAPAKPNVFKALFIGDADSGDAPMDPPEALRSTLQKHFAEQSVSMLHPLASRGGESVEIVAHRDSASGARMQYVGSHPEPTAMMSAVWPIGGLPSRDVGECEYRDDFGPRASDAGSESSGSSLSEDTSDDDDESSEGVGSYLEEDSDDEVLFTKKGKKKTGSVVDSLSSSEESENDVNGVRVKLNVDPKRPLGANTAPKRGAENLPVVCPASFTRLLNVPLRDFFFRSVVPDRFKKSLTKPLDDIPANVAKKPVSVANMTKLQAALGKKQDAAAPAKAKHALEQLAVEFEEHQLAAPQNIDFVTDVFNAAYVAADAFKPITEKAATWDARTLSALMDVSHCSAHPAAYIVDSFRDTYPAFKKTTVSTKLREIAVREGRHWVVRAALLQQYQMNDLLAKAVPGSDRPAKVRKVTRGQTSPTKAVSAPADAEGGAETSVRISTGRKRKSKDKDPNNKASKRQKRDDKLSKYKAAVGAAKVANSPEAPASDAPPAPTTTPAAAVPAAARTAAAASPAAAKAGAPDRAVEGEAQKP
eukprot:TRINITY_DN1637_c2_g1_i1.p1 TRINITY_DN1637_c2_g1~~TRINITY_DN1637_c2_g1_i1.p1  ORF type:complete len:1068 (+),score=319.61 TRINITY_DN1637_c2_g1_i1:124-3204(+)